MTSFSSSFDSVGGGRNCSALIKIPFGVAVATLRSAPIGVLSQSGSVQYFSTEGSGWSMKERQRIQTSGRQAFGLRASHDVVPASSLLFGVTKVPRGHSDWELMRNGCETRLCNVYPRARCLRAPRLGVNAEQFRANSQTVCPQPPARYAALCPMILRVAAATPSGHCTSWEGE